MIDQSTRNALKAQIRKGDYEAAAQIYQKVVNRYITPRYLQKFIEGQKNPTGQRPGSHHPLKMFSAVAEAVRQRREREQYNTSAANRLLETLMRDANHHQPIPL